VPPKKNGSFDVTYARATATHHMFSQSVLVVETGETGKSVHLGEEYSNIAVFSIDYGITDRLAVRGDISLVSSKYDGQPAWRLCVRDSGPGLSPLAQYPLPRWVPVAQKHLGPALLRLT